MRKLFLLIILLFISNQSFTQDSLKILSIKMDKQSIDVDGDGYARFRVFTLEVEANNQMEARFIFSHNDYNTLAKNKLLTKGINIIQFALGTFYEAYPNGNYNFTLNVHKGYDLLDSISHYTNPVLSNVKLELYNEDGNGTAAAAFTNVKITPYIDKDGDNYNQAFLFTSENYFNYYKRDIIIKFFENDVEVASSPVYLDKYEESFAFGSYNSSFIHKTYNLSVKAYVGSELVGEISADELNDILLESREDDGGIGLKIVRNNFYHKDYDSDSFNLSTKHYLTFDVNSSNYEMYSKYYYKKVLDSNWLFLSQSKPKVMNGFNNSENHYYNVIEGPYSLDSNIYDIKVEVYHLDLLLTTEYVTIKMEKASQDLHSTSTNIDNNNIKISTNSNGVLSDGNFFDNIALFSGGFFLSGKKDNNWWSNGVASASRITDYLGGSIEKNINNLFSPSDRESYRYAVDIGAEYNDGNKNGIYDPGDHDNNGSIDEYEDSPVYYGKYSAFSVLNDGVPAYNRIFNTQNPIGIEIQQTIFTLEEYWPSTELNNSFFVKYKIINKSGSDLDSVIFSPWADPDLGDPNDDLVGTWLEGNGMYVYNSNSDNVYGSNPPTLLLTLLQGPVVYKPGISFNDINNDNEFTNGIDLPLDSAINYKGSLGTQIIPGAMNLGLSSSNHYLQSDPNYGDPKKVMEAINYAKGLDKVGKLMNPCTWMLGSVNNDNCKLINPLFKYSGNPITNVGWLNSSSADQRIQINSEYFDLKKDSSVEIIVGYIAGRNANTHYSISSIIEMKKTYEKVRDYFNFPKMVADVNDEQVVTNFEVYQNYPNPFNPTTNIKFNLAKSGLTKVKVFDLLGREIQVLVNDILPQGLHDIPFNGSKLSSGVYFYSVESDNNKMIKKMVLLK